MNETKEKIIGIQARAFHIRYTPFTHNFWALIDDGQQVLDQIHGLAVNPITGKTTAIGNSSYLLQAVHDPTIAWSLQPGQPTVNCITGKESVIVQRWQAALNSIPAINALKISYPNWWQHFYKKNSNTVFNTLGQIMGFTGLERLLSTWSPGINQVISHKIIIQYRYHPIY
ncbi:hypothetical protein P22_0897 [Propionispora sp. 2/2-37]|uniref:hypothetical protein n=1 Tax=Propionispora sp. 2/2-37 TaxID=1677858 RepID=UPI0006BB6FD8|nr:hypothetical protein [Propionispora sp. 2/2-37]CUH94831.1 hypothetical protein P22_0897 [Propionispora sp. 2/2-37]